MLRLSIGLVVVYLCFYVFETKVVWAMCQNCDMLIDVFLMEHCYSVRVCIIDLLDKHHTGVHWSAQEFKVVLDKIF